MGKCSGMKCLTKPFKILYSVDFTNSRENRFLGWMVGIPARWEENKDIRALTPTSYHLWPQTVKADTGFNLHSEQHCQCVPGQVRPLSLEVEFQLRPDLFRHSRGTQNKVTSISGQSQVEEKNTKSKIGDIKRRKSHCLSNPSAPGRANGVKFVKLSCASDSHWAPQMLWASRAAILRAAMCAEVFRQSVTWTRRSDPLAATGEQLTEIYLADVTHPKPSACTAQQNRRKREKTFSRASLSSACHIFNILGFKKDILHFTFGTQTDVQ